jgi:hypothetical protein
MPAILDEAYISPFDKVLGGPVSNQESSGSTNIRAPYSYGISGGPTQPYQQNYRIDPQPMPEDQESNMTSIYNTHPTQNNTYYSPAPAPVAPVQVQSQPMTEQVGHRCDELINQIMSCRICRQKLRNILIEEHEQKNKDEETEQKGGMGFKSIGGFNFDLNQQSLIINFVIGMAIMFLLDRIIKMKLR